MYYSENHRGEDRYYLGGKKAAVHRTYVRTYVRAPNEGTNKQKKKEKKKKPTKKKEEKNREYEDGTHRGFSGRVNLEGLQPRTDYYGLNCAEQRRPRGRDDKQRRNKEKARKIPMRKSVLHKRSR